MSETETIKGKLKKIPLNGQSLLDFMKQQLIMRGIVFKDEESYIKESFHDDLYETYVVVGNEVYEVVEYKNLNYDDIFIATENTDGTIDVLLQYYNGGCCFSEAAETAIKQMNINKEKSK